jgi:hypothetical protein
LTKVSEEFQSDGVCLDRGALLVAHHDLDFSVRTDEEVERVLLVDREIAKPRLFRHGKLSGCGLNSVKE